MEPMELDENKNTPKKKEKNSSNVREVDKVPKKRAKYGNNESHAEENVKDKKQKDAEYKKWYDKVILTKDYMSKIYEHLFDLQKSNGIKAGYMNMQTFINHEMRSELIDWLSEVSHSLRVIDDVLFLTTHFIDRFCSSLSILDGKYELLGIVAFHIAAKVEDTLYDRTISELLSLTENVYTEREFVRMELQVLKVCRFEVSLPTVSVFLHYLEALHFTPPEMVMLALYICELFLLEGNNFLSFAPSVIACASFALARYNYGHETDIWNQYEKPTGFLLSQLRDCIWILYKLHLKAPNMKLQSVQTKYRDPKYFDVSSMEPRELSLDYLRTMSEIQFDNFTYNYFYALMKLGLISCVNNNSVNGSQYDCVFIENRDKKIFVDILPVVVQRSFAIPKSNIPKAYQKHLLAIESLYVGDSLGKVPPPD